MKKIVKYSDVRVNDILTGGRSVVEVTKLDNLIQLKLNDNSTIMKHHLMSVEVER